MPRKTLTPARPRPPRTLALLAALAGALLLPARAQVDIQPAVETEAVAGDADDPAVWVNRADPARSRILGTDKGGALYVFGLDGRIRQKISGLQRPNNVDVEYGFPRNGQAIDIAVLTEARAGRLRIYEISPAGQLTDISSPHTTVFDGQARPMGIALYRRPADGVIYALVSKKTDPDHRILGQYQLLGDPDGKVRLKEIRRFGRFSGAGTVEAVAVDDELGWVYYADESTGIRKYPADPDHPAASRELALFGTDEYSADREGIALYPQPRGRGCLICTDQLKNSRYLIYPRAGPPENPHQHGRAIKIIRGGADHTDGIEAVSEPLGPRFPQGILVAMNSKGRNFKIYDWRDIAQTGKPKL